MLGVDSWLFSALPSWLRVVRLSAIRSRFGGSSNFPIGDIVPQQEKIASVFLEISLSTQTALVLFSGWEGLPGRGHLDPKVHQFSFRAGEVVCQW